MTRTNPPTPDEFELSLFGPGVGESIVVHVGGGQWIVVDSCLDPQTSTPAALQYLDSIGVDVSTQVALVVVSHWHDDHIRGASRVLRACSAAKFACSAALQTREFLTAFAAWSDAHDSERGIEEMEQIFEELKRRAPPRYRHQSGPDYWAQSGQRLWPQNNNGIAVEALSPSSGSITMAQREFAQLLPTEGSPVTRPIAQKPNQVAVVMSVRSGNVHALLGSDLEVTKSPLVGWGPIINAWSGPRASLYKIAHHGSDTADDPAIWSTLLDPKPLAVLTPFTKSRLPRPRDIRRIHSHTLDAYSTAVVGWKPARREGAVDAMARAVATDRRRLRGPLGHIRARVPLTGDDARVELFSGARPLSDLAK